MVIKRIFRILLASVLVFILLVASLSTYFLFNSKTILLSELKKKLGPDASLSGLRIAWPGVLVIDNLSVSKSLSIKKIEVVPSILGFLHGDFVFNSIVLDEPQMTMTRFADGTFNFGVSLPKKEAAPTPGAVLAKKAPASSKTQRFYFNKLMIKQATIVFTDQATPSKEEFRVIFSRLNLNMHRPFVLNLSRFQFEGQGDLWARDHAQVGTLKLSGWIDVLSRDMDGKIDIEISSMPLFSPYYKKYLQKEVQSGHAKVGADLKAKANDLIADCHVELADIIFKEEPKTSEEGEGAEAKSDFRSLVFGSMFGAGSSSIFDFTVHTKLDHPKFEKIKLKGSFIPSVVSTVLSQPAPKTTADFKEIGEQFKSIGKEFKKVFKSE